MDNRNSSFLEDISVPAYELRQGMFVSNLDCGWGNTPFLIEGVLLKKQEEIELIKSVARYVTVDLVRSEDAALQEYLRGEFYRRSQLGDVEANTFAASRTLNSEDIQALTFDPSDAAVGETRKIESVSFASRLKRLTLCLRWLRDAKDIQNLRSEFPKAPRLNYLPLEIGLVSHPPTEFSWPALRLAQQTVKETIATLADVTRTIELYRTIDSRQIVRAAETLAENMIHFPEAMIWASRLRKKDGSLLRRSLQAGVYLTAMGRHLGFPQKLLGELAATGLLLDIGKTQVDEKLLGKPGPHTVEETRASRRHVDLGLALLNDADSVSLNIRRAVGEHHEQINGDGYPQGLHGGDISVFGKMAAIVDAYVAMVNPRPYAETLAPHEAIKQLFAGANTRWFGPLVEQFVQSIGIYPIGSLVELASGHIAIVIQHSRERRLEPKILILTHSDKRRRFPPLQLDLLKHNARETSKRLRIKQGLPDGAYGIDVEEFYSKRR
jgi:HD-GYP domain-containing protein (c-di-GMP phosphodiesterase class II)